MGPGLWTSSVELFHAGGVQFWRFGQFVCSFFLFSHLKATVLLFWCLVRFASFFYSSVQFNAYYGFSGFAKEVTPCSNAKTVIPRDLFKSLLPRRSFRGIHDKPNLFIITSCYLLSRWKAKD